MDFEFGIQVRPVKRYWQEGGQKGESAYPSAMKANDKENRFRLPCNKIIKKNSEIKYFLNNSEKKSGVYVNIYIQNSSEEKFAVLVTKKAGSAVERNRMKRLIREIYRLHPEWFKEKRIIFTIKQVNIKYSALKTEIKKLLSIP